MDPLTGQLLGREHLSPQAGKQTMFLHPAVTFRCIIAPVLCSIPPFLSKIKAPQQGVCSALVGGASLYSRPSAANPFHTLTLNAQTC